jgi:hypothetical protein
METFICKAKTYKSLFIFFHVGVPNRDPTFGRSEHARGPPAKKRVSIFTLTYTPLEIA